MGTGKELPRRRIASVKLVQLHPEVYEPYDESLNPAFVVYLGVLTIIAGVTSVGISVYTSIAKIQYLAEYPPDDMMPSDWYYALLFPMTLPVTVTAIFLWGLSIKLFKHAGNMASQSHRGRSYGLATVRFHAIVDR